MFRNMSVAWRVFSIAITIHLVAMFVFYYIDAAYSLVGFLYTVLWPTLPFFILWYLVIKFGDYLSRSRLALAALFVPLLCTTFSYFYDFYGNPFIGAIYSMMFYPIILCFYFAGWVIYLNLKVR